MRGFERVTNPRLSNVPFDLNRAFLALVASESLAFVG